MEKHIPKIGIFKYSCCAGCQFQLIYFQKHLAEMLGAVDIVYCKMFTAGGLAEGPFDAALIEGAITESWQADQLKKVRAVSDYLIPIGSCAVCGGVPAVKNTTTEGTVQKRVYTDTSLIHAIKAHPVDHYVKADGYVRGCPVGERDLTELLVALLLGKKPEFPASCVCAECKRNNNICLLIANNEPCMGPVTAAGCGALCPSHGRACFGCWGPMKDANAGALAKKFRDMGLRDDTIFRKFTAFGEPCMALKPGQVKP